MDTEKVDARAMIRALLTVYESMSPSDKLNATYPLDSEEFVIDIDDTTPSSEYV